MLRNRKFQRSTAAAVLVTFTSLVLSPLAHARQLLAGEGESAGSAQVADADQRFSLLLQEVAGELRGAGGAAAQQAKAAPPGQDNARRAQGIRKRYKDLKALYATVDLGFEDSNRRLREAKLPQEMLDRQALAQSRWQARRAEFDSLAARVDASVDGSAEQADALSALAAFMTKYQHGRRHQFTNPDKLPFGAPDSKVRAPYVSPSEFQASLFQPRFKDVQLAGAIPQGLSLSAAAPAATPEAADLAETVDVQLTPAIRSQAAALGNNPVRIYSWVRNNIAFIPSYGSIQGSELTLQNRRGNAFDTASLLVALYRASGIPARYVYGTIEVPADKVMNWVGGVSKPEAAQGLLGQGGIPNVGLVSGGRIDAIRMEHVWVQAHVDLSPSRGAAGHAGNGWVPMDASFKQYQYSRGMDLASNVQVDGAALLADLTQGGVLNPAQGTMQNLNLAKLQSAYAAYQNRAIAYMDSQKSNATVTEALGAQTVLPENRPLLQGALPYKTVAVGSTMAALPDRLRWRFRTNIYPADGFSDSSSPLIEINQPTAQLAGRKITLSFVPASKADQDLVNTYMPKAHADGSPIQLSELPATLPGYLLNMKAELRVDGQLAAQSAGSMSMGSDVRQSNAYFNPSRGDWEGGDDSDITVGEYNAIGVDLQGVGQAQLKSLQTKLEGLRARLMQYQANPGDQSPLAGLSKEDFTGDMVYNGILTYFAQVDATDNRLARMSGAVTTYRLPSYGRYFTTAAPRYFFGIVRSVGFSGVGMDVDYLRYHVEANNGDNAVRRDYLRQAGMAGSLAEGSVPVQLLRKPALPPTDPSQPLGYSAVSALQIAAREGQRIFSLDHNNTAQHGAILAALSIDSGSRAEIEAAVAVGRDVVVHEKNVTVKGWTGAGYIILDQDTGAGAYKVAGGTNGGGSDAAGDAITQAIMGLNLALGLLPFGLMLAVLTGPVIALAITIILVWSLVLYEIQSMDEGPARSIIANLAWGAFGIAVGALTGSIWVALAAWILGAIGNAFIALAPTDQRRYQIA
ncbi:transglutaminase family protein [Pseudoduganella sp. UC29_106]|uniref:transglutaminase-like domain-containing protein n=1 Tax=Pseudoduganella sp. UC29_106 TaxID=3374553 RepID=UPI0037573BEF